MFKAGGQEHSIFVSSCVGIFIPTDIHIAKLRGKKRVYAFFSCYSQLLALATYHCSQVRIKDAVFLL